MASKENEEKWKYGASRTLTLSPREKQLVQDDCSERVDSGIGDSLPHDRSCTDSYSMDDQSRIQECSATAELRKQTEDMKITEVDEGYNTVEKESAEFSSTSNDSTDGPFLNRPIPIPHPSLIEWSMLSFVQTNNLRYIFAPLWPLLLNKNDDGDTSLHLAIINCQEQIISAILDVLPRPEYFDIYNDLTQTPLHLAVITRQHKIVQKLIDYGASIDLVDRNGQTCLHLACQRGDLKSLRAIFKPRPTKLNLYEKLQEILEMKNFDGLSPLCVAVKANHVEIVKELILLGADVNAIDSKSGNTALHLAIEDNNLPMISCLLFQGHANPDAMSYSGSTPLHIAAGLELKTIVATLLAIGANASIENFEGDTAFKIATESFEDILENEHGLEGMEN